MTAGVLAPEGVRAGEVVLQARALGKEYRLYSTPRQRFLALFSSKARHRSHWALRDVSFELRRGQCIGVVGDNGAGKSSLLKLLAGTMQPSTGQLERIGRVTAILELGAGFHPDFTGRENLYFGGGLIGISHDEMAQLEAGIVEFSQLGDALDRAVKTYSSGMVVRLAFALVTAVQPDVLIIDEALAVGDQHFQKKCVERILDFKAKGCTILFCSHSFYHIRRLCDSAMWLRDGTVALQGDTETVVSAYEQHTRLRDSAVAESAQPGVLPVASVDQGNAGVLGGAQLGGAGELSPAAQPTVPALGDGGVAKITSLVVDDLSQDDPPRLQGKDLRVSVTAQVPGDASPHFLVMLEQYKGTGITSEGTNADGVTAQRMANGEWRVSITFPDLPLFSGEYVVSAYLLDSSGVVVFDEWYQHIRFSYLNPSLTPGLVRLPHFWGER